MTANNDMTGWEGQPDAEVLQALAGQDLSALRELHRRYARLLYAFAQKKRVPNPDRWVRDAFVRIMRHAGCFARTSLQPRIWVIAMVQDLAV
ncbi:hypothetical protein DEDE109153_15365 [Deinococcus deserti]|uniref:hypothetical protein n=1 Tax=Deinococcus deserti TaxID=310783 RepID=UPI00030A9050|nr:hypothetical protein [Deinococcus deserti]